MQQTEALRTSRMYWETTGDKWDKPEIMWAENPESSGRQWGDKCEIMQTKLFSSSSVRWGTSPVGDKLEITRAKNPECSGRQLGEKWTTSAESGGPFNKHSEHPMYWEATGGSGDKRETTRCRRQVGGKCEIMQTKAPTSSRVDWETSGRQTRNYAGAWNHAGTESRVQWAAAGRQVGDKCGPTRAKSCGPKQPEHPEETGGRQAWNYAGT